MLDYIKDKINNFIYNKGDNRILTKYFKLISLIFIILIIVNMMLFFSGDYYQPGVIENKSKTDKVIDSIYYTTTELSTVGYGDFSPITKRAKLVTIGSHIAIIILAFNIFSEFIPMRKFEVSVDETKKINEEEMRSNIENKYKINHALSKEDKIMKYKEIIEQLKAKKDDHFGNIDYLFFINQIAKLEHQIESHQNKIKEIEDKYHIDHNISNNQKILEYQKNINTLKHDDEDYLFLVHQIIELNNKIK